jgi:predicted hydrolase (HD superfamily)
MEKALHACDDVTGLIIACALVRPDQDVRAVKLKSVRKKWKIRAFAAGVDRDEVDRACAELGVEREAHLEAVLRAMQDAAESLGLAGTG